MLSDFAHVSSTWKYPLYSMICQEYITLQIRKKKKQYFSVSIFLFLSHTYTRTQTSLQWFGRLAAR